MKLREVLGKYSKDEVYDLYMAICYSNKLLSNFRLKIICIIYVLKEN